MIRREACRRRARPGFVAPDLAEPMGCGIMSDTPTTVPEAESAEPTRAGSDEIHGQADPAVQEPPRRYVSSFRRRQEPIAPPDTIVSRASSVMERVATTSISEVEALIRELEQLRDF